MLDRFKFVNRLGNKAVAGVRKFGNQIADNRDIKHAVLYTRKNVAPVVEKIAKQGALTLGAAAMPLSIVAPEIGAPLKALSAGLGGVATLAGQAKMNKKPF